jgi:2-iminobutanoate/2-iminopropanoate deaminase
MRLLSYFSSLTFFLKGILNSVYQVNFLQRGTLVLDMRIKKYGLKEVPFSSATKTESLLFVSGQGGTDPDTGEVMANDLESQTILTMQNIQSILSESDLTLEDVVKVNVFLTNRNHYEEFNQIYSRLVPRPYPARTLIYCELNFDLLVEIDVIAKLKSR